METLIVILGLVLLIAPIVGLVLLLDYFIFEYESERYVVFFGWIAGFISCLGFVTLLTSSIITK